MRLSKRLPRPEGMPEELWQALTEKKLPVPPMAQLEAIVRAGAGEHQDRLWNLLVDNAIEAWAQNIKFLAIKNNLGPEDIERMLRSVDPDSIGRLLKDDDLQTLSN